MIFPALMMHKLQFGATRVTKMARPGHFWLVCRAFFKTLYLSVVLGLLGSANALAEEVTKKSALIPIQVNLNWNHQFEFAGYYAAIAKGYYADIGLDVTLNAWQPGSEPINEVLSGKAEFGIGYSTLVVDAVKGAPIQMVLASFQYSPMILLSHSPIVSLNDLNGKTVMHHNNLPVMALMNLAQKENRQSSQTVLSSANLQDFIDHKVDLYAGYATNEPFRLQKEKVPFYITDPKTYGIQSYGNIVFTSKAYAMTYPTRVRQFKEATIKGWQYAITHQTEIVDFILQHYPVVKTREFLLTEALETEKYVKFGNTPIGDLNATKLQAIARVAMETGLLNADQYQAFQAEDLIFKDRTSFLTEAEKDYLVHHPVIQIGVDPQWAPFEFIDEQGRYSGLAAEYFQLFEQKLGVKFEPIKDLPWSKVLEGAFKHDFEVLSCGVASPERQVYLNFTKPYLSFPMVLVARSGVSFIEHYQQLAGKVIAVTKGYWSQEYLKNNFPDVSLLLVNSVQEGLDSVLKGEAFGYSGNLAAVNYVIKQRGLDGLQVVGQADQRFELAIGVNNHNPLLLSILQKSLNEIPSEQAQGIYNRWIQLEMVNKVDYEGVLKSMLPAAVAILSLFVLFIGYSYYRRQQQKLLHQILDEQNKAALVKAAHAQRQAEQEAKHREDQAKFFAMITHELKTPLAVIDGAIQSLKILQPNPDSEIAKRHERIERGVQRLNGLVNRFLQQDMLDGDNFKVQWQSFALRPVFEEIAKHVSPQRKFNFVCHQADEVVADKNLLELALSNLLDNAHKYSDEHQPIILMLEHCQDENGEWFMISIEDFGPGLEGHQIKDLVEAYQRGHHMGDIPGVGLGLYLVNKIVKLHQGELLYHPQERLSGSIFTLKIPKNPVIESEESPSV